MTTGVLVEPPPELLLACEQVEHAKSLVLKDVMQPFPGFGVYEADVEARVLIAIQVRHFEAMLCCARLDLVLFPAANTLTRAVLEHGVKVRWLLRPADALEREARFLAHLSDEERMLRRVDRAVGGSVGAERAAGIQAFRESVEAQLPRATPRLARIPSFDKMLAEVGEEKRYGAYTIMSQYTHASHHAGTQFRKHLGNKREMGEKDRVSDWGTLVQICWWSFFHAATTIERVCAKRELRTISQQQVEQIRSGLARLSELD